MPSILRHARWAGCTFAPSSGVLFVKNNLVPLSGFERAAIKKKECTITASCTQTRHRERTRGLTRTRTCLRFSLHSSSSTRVPCANSDQYSTARQELRGGGGGGTQTNRRRGAMTKSPPDVVEPLPAPFLTSSSVSTL